MNIYFERSEILKLFRNRANLSKRDVAKYLGKTPATIANYESGYTFPSVEDLAKLKKLYGEEFAHAMKMIYDYGKNPYMNFKDYPNGETSELSFEMKHYPNLTRIKAYLNEVDKRKKMSD